MQLAAFLTSRDLAGNACDKLIEEAKLALHPCKTCPTNVARYELDSMNIVTVLLTLGSHAVAYTEAASIHTLTMSYCGMIHTRIQEV